MKKVGLLLILLVMALSLQAQDGRKPKAILFMLDGLRGDAIEATYMPNIRNLRDGKWQPGYQCAWSLTGQTVPNARPSSAANHVAIATCVGPEKTGVFNNGQTKNGKYAEWPTWLARLADGKDVKSMFVYSWGENKDLGIHPKVAFKHGNDLANGRDMAALMAAADAPDAVLMFIDLPDAGGHGTGFYPYGQGYLRNCYLSDKIVGDILSAIASRATFAQEDWLVMVTGDHGGYARTHGIWGGHATTVPVLLAGRHVKQGRLPGLPRHYDLSTTALTHFGMDVASLKLDGKVIGQQVAADTRRSLKDGLAMYLPFSDKEATNAVANNLKATVLGAKAVSGNGGGFSGGCLHMAGGESVASGVRLDGTEKLAFENQKDFAMTLWVRMGAQQAGDPPIVSNKDWRNGALPGFVLVGARKTESVPNLGVCFNYALANDTKRVDMGTFDIDYGKWVFYAVTRNAEGVLTFCQGGADGRLYWIAEQSADMVLASGYPWHIGQDGSGQYKWSFSGDVDDFALWTRALSFEDIRRIYEAGRTGRELGDILE